MLSDNDLKAMRERCQAATPGPWRQSFHAMGEDGEDGFSSSGPVHREFDDDAEDAARRDAAFIAAARTDLPRCLDEIERLRAVAEAAERTYKRQTDYQARWAMEEIADALAVWRNGGPPHGE